MNNFNNNLFIWRGIKMSSEPITGYSWCNGTVSLSHTKDQNIFRSLHLFWWVCVEAVVLPLTHNSWHDIIVSRSVVLSLFCVRARWPCACTNLHDFGGHMQECAMQLLHSLWVLQFPCLHNIQWILVVLKVVSQGASGHMRCNFTRAAVVAMSAISPQIHNQCILLLYC